ncbi:MAG: aminoacyl-tRNA hydrolase [Lewinellaceae bacterium]|nr:aminoacyl-tRNA hydrolase [Lewinellaceae bacterium]
MNTAQLLQELTYRTARSGGKGGQNVNKVETKVEACLALAASTALTDPEKELIRQKLSGKISAGGILSVTNQTKRSQLANKLMATQKLLRLVQTALIQPKKRKQTTLPSGVKAARLEAKRRLSAKKASRRIHEI